MTDIFPAIEPYETRFLDVSDGHRLHVTLSGTPKDFQLSCCMAVLVPACRYQRGDISIRRVITSYSSTNEDAGSAPRTQRRASNIIRLII